MMKPNSSYRKRVRRSVLGMLLRAAACLLAAVVATGAASETMFQNPDGLWIQEARLTPGAGEDPGNFGEALAVSGDTPGDTLFAGAWNADVDGNFNQGAVDVFTRDEAGWTGYQRIAASDGAAFDNFGRSVAVEGDLAVVGAPGVAVDGDNTHGAVYVFTRDGAGWSEQTRLTAEGDEVGSFGRAVALLDGGNVLLVGAPNTDPDGVFNQGAVYAFTREETGWSEPLRLTAGDGVQSDQFGITLAAHGSSVLAGAYFADVGGNSSQGAVYVLTLKNDTWNEEAKLVASDGAQSDFFGQALAIENGTAVVGVRAASIDGNNTQGAAYVFARDGGQWTEQHKLVAPDGATFDAFGTSVAIAGDTLLAGATGADVEGEHATGVVYRFVRAAGGWEYRERFGDQEARSFGSALALAGEYVAMGAPGGIPAPGVTVPPAVYVYRDFQPDAGTFAIGGMVRSLGHCGAEPAMMPGVEVEIAGTGDGVTVETDSVGRYHALLPSGQGPLTVTIAAPGHIPWVLDGVEPSGGEILVADADLVLDAPCAVAEPGEITLELPDGITAEVEVTIGNFNGGAALDWNVDTAVSPFLTGDAGIVDCDDDLGLIAHDDGVVDNGYTSGNAEIDEVVFVDRFTPSQYPAAFRAVCIAFFSLGPEFLDFEIVVFDDDGGQGGQVGSPGTELGSLAATAGRIPIVTPPLPPDLAPAWFEFDLSALDIVIESGSVYIGARWQPVAPAEPDVVIAADQGVGSAGGGWWWNTLDEWVPMGVPGSFQPYRSLFVRAAQNLGGCHAPENLPWLDVSPSGGTVPAGAGDPVRVTVDTHDLAPGAYLASLCIETSDPAEPLLVVPFRLTVIGDGIFHDRFE